MSVTTEAVKSEPVEQLLTQVEAARKSGLPIRSLRHLVKQGRIRSYLIADGIHRVRLSDVHSVIKECPVTNSRQ